MSNRHEQMLRNNYDSFAKGDLSPMMDSLTDDVRWHMSGGSPLAGEYIGKRAVADLFGKMMDLYQATLQVRVIDMLANDRHGIVLTEEAAQYKGRKMELQGVHKWGIRDGKLAEFSVFYSDAYHQFWSAHRD